MAKLVTLLEVLSDEDIQWLLSTGVEQTIEPDTVVIRAGEYIEYIYIVMEGSLGVFLPNANKQINTVGPGEILGEMSYIEDTQTSATVISLETTVLLSISRESLDNRIVEDPDFGRRLFKGVSIAVSQRLRQAMMRVDYMLDMIEKAKIWHI
ncbi:Crp/Fnr family transcriptional regulator [Candidatus Magnetomonas plexicatena]|uniref:Crp/Fnr family transcriptional regulator n=1 Tax=Candidatus Magnetomonas plexicatena TaxID=2552947 RepID=UPI001C77F7B3|nr:cyclic nucleotide-binding domain-containing protein [Nitrospirales bacterium LBB_01]